MRNTRKKIRNIDLNIELPTILKALYSKVYKLQKEAINEVEYLKENPFLLEKIGDQVDLKRKGLNTDSFNIEDFSKKIRGEIDEL
jgi:hypothetical protein